MTLLLVVGDESRVRWIRPREHRASVRPAAVRFESLLRGLGGKENGILAHDLSGQLSQRSDVVHNPDAASMGGEHEV